MIKLTASRVRGVTSRAGRLLIGLAWALIAAGGLAAGAQAVVLHPAPGRFIAVTPVRHPARAAMASALTTGTSTLSAAGQLTWHHGPVIHSSSPYLLFWAPSGQSFPASTTSLLESYFTDAAANSEADNVFAVSRQYTDATGFADYRQSFSAARQAIVDTTPYPARDKVNCPEVASDHPICVTDAQLQAEIGREIAAAKLPSDGAATATSLPGAAPVYFVVLPTDVDLCFTEQGVACATDSFCAYHSSFVDGHGDNVVYAAIPTWTVSPAGDPKACQSDGQSALEEPNGSAADVVLKYLNHENTEALTDPTGYGWYNDASGNEEADNCNAYGPADPADGMSPAAFSPALGGSPSGSLYDQAIGHHYYLQSEWSNGEGNCEMRPTAASLTATFTGPAGAVAPHATESFSPAASQAGAGVSSASWNFGDGTTAFKGPASPLAPVSHAYAAAGAYTVTLRLVDRRGNLTTATRRVVVQASAPLAGATSAGARIVGVRIQQTTGGDKLVVSVSAGGRVQVGATIITVKAAASAPFTLHMSSTQLATLRRTGVLRRSETIVFSPTRGTRSVRQVTVVFRPTRQLAIGYSAGVS